LITGSSSDDKELLRLVAEGNELAFRELFDRYNKRLFIFADEMLKSAADAEEIVQECFAKIWISRNNLPQIENPGSYFYQMVRNKTLDHIRKVAREQRLIDQVWANISQSDNSLEEELRRREYQEMIEKALAQLPEQKRNVYRLSREKEYSHEQIASFTGLSKSRVNNILVETIKHIKASLGLHSKGIALLFWISSWEAIF
jgi:RNA polymerase sigma-70 factor (ECF subfamily)